MLKRWMIIIVILLSLSTVSADTGPHPSAEIYFFVTYNEEYVPDTAIVEIITNNEVDTAGNCLDGICSIYYYRIERVPSTFQVQIILPEENKTLLSDPISFSYLEDSTYYDLAFTDANLTETTIGGTDFLEEEASDPNESNFLLLLFSLLSALGITIILEVLTAMFLFKIWKIQPKKWKRPLVTIFLINLISVPLVWGIVLLTVYVSDSYNIGFILGVILSEICAFVSEAFVIHTSNKKLFSLKKSFLLSFILNLTSFILGSILLSLVLILLGAIFSF